MKGDATIRIRRDEDIYSTDGGWFKARWHFSFDEYYDEDNMGIGTLRVFNHDTLARGAIWPMHPHKNVEGITYVVAGEFRHADSLGNGGVFQQGAVQRMTLGSGAFHSEQNASKTKEVQFIQMWIMPSRNNLKPSVEQKQFTEEDRKNKWLQILKPENTEGTGVSVHQDVTIHVSKLEANKNLVYEFNHGRRGYFYLLDGEIILNDEKLSKGDAIKILHKGTIRITATKTSEMILVDTIKERVYENPKD